MGLLAVMVNTASVIDCITCYSLHAYRFHSKSRKLHGTPCVVRPYNAVAACSWLSSSLLLLLFVVQSHV